ncbi:XdhC family protein [Aurantiacibacter spongiae]|uniref:XdhC family protein n=1 Tax=Aurantiacibacter spongiae TaxID=2488860 RepID=A0A3N5DMZ8_9SPHN|nr:XdhC family protein [Aurantiacibacter spongiae]RPF72285.1 hypothetical protein EG799_12110 [Aurantiacibacter spongiae]
MPERRPFADDHAALRAVAASDAAGLCTIVNIDGSFSRRLGAQLAVHADQSVTGSLADGCLERQLASDLFQSRERRVVRYGAGSDIVDFRLPCGGGLDILLDPAPDRGACRAAVAALDARQQTALSMPRPSPLEERRFVPTLRLVLLGEGPELAAMAHIARAAGMTVETHGREDSGLSLGRAPDHLAADPWSAIVLLFHDHEWERAILDWALRTPAFFIGAQGGAPARAARAEALGEMGFAPEQIGRIASPIGTVKHSRDPAGLALSVLAQVAGEYEARHPHHAGS